MFLFLLSLSGILQPFFLEKAQQPQAYTNDKFVVTELLGFDEQRKSKSDTVQNDTFPRLYELNEFVLLDHSSQIRREESNSIEIIKHDFIRENRGGSLMQSLERIPGINLIGIGSGASKPLIRGLGFNQVMVVENGIKHEGQQWGADHGLEVDQFAADQILIIKGPASFKYGSDAIAGVIDIREKRPPSQDGLGGSVEMGSRSNNAWYGGSVNLVAKRNKLFAEGRLTLADYGDFKVPSDSVFIYDFGVALPDGRVRNSAGKESNFSGRVGYLGKYLRSTFSASSVNTKAGFFANAHGLEPRQVDTELHDQSSRDILLPFQEVRHSKVVMKSSYAVGKHYFQLDLGYQRNDRKEWSQYVNHGYMPATFPTEMHSGPDLERAFEKEVVSLNLKDELLLERHEFAFGANSEFQHNDIGGWGFLIPAFQQYSYGFYAIDKFKLNPQWRLTAGLRYDQSKILVEEYQDWFPSVQDAALASESDYLYRAQAFNRKFNRMVWSVGFNFTPGDLILKGNLGSSYRMPIAKELAANGVNYHYFRYERGNADLDAEKSLQLDMEAELKKERWLLSISPFINYFPNFIYLNPTAELDILYGAGNQVFNYTQAEVLRYGGELSVMHLLTEELSLEFIGEYAYSEQNSGEKTGYTLPFSPPPTGILNATYKPVDKGVFSSSYMAVDYRITAEQTNIVPPEKVTPGYQLINLRAGSSISIFDQQIQINAQVNNVFNIRYLNHTSFYRLINLPEAGRNITLSLNYQF